MRCKSCGEELDFTVGVVADGDGYLHHSSCFTAIETGQTIIDYDRDKEIHVVDNNIIVVDFEKREKIEDGG